jgi:hypothetical protein
MFPSNSGHVSTFRRSAALLLCCLCLILIPLTSIFGQREPAGAIPAENKPSRSTIRGRVIFADSEQPLRRAVLRLRKDFNRDFLKRTISSKRGDFRFQDIPAGTYYVDVEAPGIVSLSNGVSFTNFGFSIEEAGLTQVTVDGSNDLKTEVKVIRGGVITGRVAYADGEPATHARIVLYRQRGQTRVLFFRAASLITDDRGIYRIEGLPAGQYFIGAVENHSGGDQTFPRNGSGLVTAYHPSATSIDTATPITVEPGSDAREVNIKFDAEPLRLSGTIRWKDGNAPVKRATVFLRRMDEPKSDLDPQRFLKIITPLADVDNDDLMMRDMFFFTLLTTNAPYLEADESGHFSFLDVPEGTYSLSVEAPLPSDKPVAPKPEKQEFAFDFNLPDFSNGLARGRAEVTIEDKNVDDVLIELSEGASIAGSVVIEGEPLDVPKVAVDAISEGSQTLFNLPSYVKKDRTFLIQSLPAGAVRIDIVEARDANYYIRSITGKGLDLLNEPLPLAEGERVTGVRIVLGSDLATVEGRLVAASGRSVPGGGVVLVPVDQRKRNTSSLIRLARADSEGKFSMRLAPGEYLTFAWSVMDEPTLALEAYIKQNSATAQRITLQPDETKVLDIQTSKNAFVTPREP